MGLINFVKPIPLTFIEKKHIADDVYSYIFRLDKEVEWHAGQHGMLELKLPNGKISRRMFSLSSAPAELKVIATTNWRGKQASDYKSALWDLQPGDKARLRGPVGPMYIRDYTAHYVFIAGGIGITPFRSILKEAALNGHDLNATLLYANRDENSISFKAELDSLAGQLPHVEINYIISPDAITEQNIKHASENLKDTIYFLSGPPKMVRSYKKILKEMGMPRRQIKSDPFMGYK